MSEKRIKVTDRRMFTPDGELRDIYKDVEKASASAETATPPKQTSADQPSPDQPKSEAQTAAPPELKPREEPVAEEEPLESGATFQDLVGLLGQSASVYLTQSAQRIENRAEMLEMARMHVDLLSVVKQKTKGNLLPGEQALLDDALYQLRMAFVQQG